MQIHGLKQALLARLRPPEHKAEQQNQPNTVNVHSQSVQHLSPLQIGYKALSLSLHRNVRIDEQAMPEPKESSVQPLTFDFEAVAKNVMDFVEARVRYAKADGADDDKLQQMISQARRGIDMGFGQARDELDGMGLMSPELKEGIAQSYDLIGQRMDDFEKELFTPDSEHTPAQRDVADVADVTQLRAGEGRETSLEITTRDGDKVTIHLGDRSSLQYSHSVSPRAMAAYGIGPNQGSEKASEHRSLASERMQISFSQSQHFNLAVEGELDDEELKAIGELVTDLDELASVFFSGDLKQAFEMASEVGYNDEELMGFAFNLKHTRAVSVSKVYSPSVKPELQNVLMPLVDYAQQLRAYQPQADALLPEDEQSKLAEQVVAMLPDREKQFEYFAELRDSLANFTELNNRILKAISSLT